MGQAAEAAPIASTPEGTLTRTDASLAVTEASAPYETPVSQVASSQGLQEVSEAELMGIEADTQEAKSATSEPSVTEEKPAETKPAEEKPAEEKPAEEKPAEEKPADDKPPKGYVPLAAVHEVRGENRYLKQQIAELNAKLAQAPITQPPASTLDTAKFAEFKELTDDEFTALAEEDAPEALAYMKKLADYRDYTRSVQEQQRQAENYAAQAQQIYADTHAAMEEAVPGLLVDGSPAAAEFMEFAVDLGFTDDMFYLTDPSTKIILPGETEPLLLGEQAAQIIRVLANARKAKTAAQPAISEEAIEAKLRTKIEAELLSKLKTTSPAFRSLSDVPDSSETRPEFNNRVLSEAEFSLLNAKEQDLYLAGA